MKLKYIINFAVIVLILNGISCKEKPTEPPVEEFPPGYQHDIPWPSLADSPWPIYRGDPQSTGRSKFAINQLNQIAWVQDSFFIGNGITIGSDSTIYFSVVRNLPENNLNEGLVALNFDGSVKWKFEFQNWIVRVSSSTPIIGSENTIYISSPTEKKIYAVNPNGTKKWELDLVNIMISQTGPIIDKDGTIYVLGTNSNSNWELIAISINGDLLWSFAHADFRGEGFNGMSISPDSKTLYIPGNKNTNALIAFDLIEKKIKWIFEGKGLSTSGIPIIDNQNNIYLISNDSTDFGCLYSLNSNGSVRWQYKFGGNYTWNYIESSFNLFAMDYLGNIYFGYETLICIDYFGTKKWEVDLNGNNIISPISIDKNNNIFFIQGPLENKKISFYNSNGNLVNTIAIGNESFFSYSLALGFNTIYHSSFRSGKIQAIK